MKTPDTTKERTAEQLQVTARSSQNSQHIIWTLVSFGISNVILKQKRGEKE